MEKTLPNILIIGGGVAGMSAARTLSDQDVIVHLVEKENALGGHAALWACMATETCENCGACLAIGMADKVKKQKNCRLHLGTQVKTLKKKEGQYEIALDDDTRIQAEKIIMATGFTPFDPAGSPSLHFGAYETLITTAELNTLMKEERLADIFKGKTDPKIAFLQCVGSRNRKQGRDYCSQVCCRISMRHANKLSYLYPEAAITIFHMDLQVIGKETRPLMKKVAEKATLIQGVPAEILEDKEDKRLTMVTEDKATGARVSSSFDMIVLSVGLLPSATLEPMAGLLDLKPNSWGFFNTDDIKIPEDVTLAGCAGGPRDILSSKQDGRIAAFNVMSQLGITLKKQLNIAVFGDGSAADQTAAALASSQYATYLFGNGQTLPEKSPVEKIDGRQIISVGGTAGNFSIAYKNGNGEKIIPCAAIIAAPEPESRSGLNGLSNAATDLDDFIRKTVTDPDTCPDHTAILLDTTGPEFKTKARKALDIALTIRELGKKVSLIMNKMLVHGATGQQRYDAARKKGVDFFRYETPKDLEISTSGKGISISIKEATLPSMILEIDCDALVLPARIVPGKAIADTAALLKSQVDKEGFLQSANTRHRLVQSPRKGIFFAGAGHDESDTDDLENEIQEIMAGLTFQDFSLPDVDTGVEINQKKCAQCLTCIRICPHSAIVMNEKRRPQIVPDACFSCHLCVSNCPAYAIESKAFTNDQLGQRAKKGKVALLACENSAALAAGGLTLPDHVTLIPVPCACRISSDMILKTLLNGAQKAIVCGCHQDNCISREGSQTAQRSVAQVLKIPGVDPTKVIWEPVAANEAGKLERLMSLE